MTQILTVTINPAVDVSTSVDRVEPVRKLRCRVERREAGGGGINVARVIKRLGGDVLAVYAVGGVIGDVLLELVQAEGVLSRPIRVAQTTRESFTVLDEGAQNEFRFVLPGPILSEGEWGRCLEEIAKLAPDNGYIVASGSLARGVPEDFYARLARQAKIGRRRLVVDASGPALKAALGAGVYLAKPNLRELQDLLGEPLETLSSQLAACQRLIRSGQTEIVALSLGAAGALLVTADRAWVGDPLPVKVMSSVGAGDSFLGGLIWSLASGRDHEDALRYAIAAGSAALLDAGTQLCQASDVLRLVSEVKLRRFS